jgi:biopolymer transport protein ExbB/TolQ
LLYLASPDTEIGWDSSLVVGQFTSDGDSAASIGFERGQQRHSTVYIENLRDTRHLSESHRKLVKNVDFSKQMFPGINKNEQDRVRARFSMDVTKRCSAEIKQAHKQFTGHMTKNINLLKSTFFTSLRRESD